MDSRAIALGEGVYVWHYRFAGIAGEFAAPLA